MGLDTGMYGATALHVDGASEAEFGGQIRHLLDTNFAQAAERSLAYNTVVPRPGAIPDEQLENVRLEASARLMEKSASTERTGGDKVPKTQAHELKSLVGMLSRATQLVEVGYQL